MYFFIRKILLLIYKITYNLSFEGLENIPKEGGYIFASNHRSYADPVLISIPVRPRFAYMAKEELFKQNIFFTALIKTMGAFPVVRGTGDMQVIETAVNKLKSGKNLVIFPEGTRSKDGKVGKGKTGVAMIAAMAGADVVPVGIVFEGKLCFRKKVVVKFGKPISAENISVSAKPSSKELKSVKLTIMDSITNLVEG